MKIRRLLKRSAAVLATMMLAAYLGWQPAPPENPQVSAVKKTESPQAQAARPSSLQMPTPGVAADSVLSETIARSDSTGPGDDQAYLEHNLLALEQLRQMPEAAPLVDEIVAYLKSGKYADPATTNLPPDEDGERVRERGDDDRVAGRMLSDERIRDKWKKLMALLAEHPEALKRLEQ